MVWKGLLAIIVSCTLVCAAAAAATEPKRFVKVEHFTNKKIFYDKQSPVNGTILYLACDLDNRETDFTCEIIQQDTERRISCPFNLTNVAGKFITSHQVARDKAVVIYIDSKTAPVKKHLKLLNIDLNSCKTTEHEVTAPTGSGRGNGWLHIWQIGFLPYGDKYEVIFNNQILCNGTFCKGTYDHEGNVVRELNNWGKVAHNKLFLLNVASVNPNSPADGYLIVYKDNDQKIGANLIKDGDVKVLGTWEFPKTIILPIATGYSTNDNIIGVCVQSYRKISCTFFDLEGRVKQKAHLDEEGELLHAVYNLADGFLILTQACLEPNFNDHVLFCKDQKFFVRRYDSQGKLAKKVAVDDFRWDNFEYAAHGKFFRNDVGEYCASLAVFMNELQPPKRDVPQSVELATQCFDDLI